MRGGDVVAEVTSMRKVAGMTDLGPQVASFADDGLAPDEWAR
jgi:hypothetical protein